jgi:uroporphyrinogen decarboxylase
MEMGVWPETIERWHTEGLPWWVENLFQLSDHLGMDKSFNCDWLHINDGFYPLPSESIIEEGSDWVMIENSVGFKYKRGIKGASIPHYIRFPVKSSEDYNKLSRYLNPADPARYAPGYRTDVAGRVTRGELKGISFSGLFGFPRDLMGLENWSVAFYEDEKLVERILNDRIEFAAAVYSNALESGDIDFVQIWEDMAYKTAPLISPAFIRSHMLDGYKKIVKLFRNAGVEIIMMDCDGKIDSIAPILLESGMNGLLPCERAAGSDPVELRKKSEGIALMGGIDKRALAEYGRQGARSELLHIQPLLQEGGYIPHIDHFIPPDISYDTFVYYIHLKQELLVNPTMKL